MRKSYRSLQKAIARGDVNGIEIRWEYGHRILADPKKMSASGKSLRHGALESLIADAKAVGSELSEREIRRRIQCARMYPTRAQIGQAMADFGSWTELVEAGFPPIEVHETPSPDDVLDSIEQSPIPPADIEQLSMFPEIVNDVPLERATLRQLRRYAEQMRKMTDSYARRDEKRSEHLDALEAAVGGDLEVTYAEAVAALGARNPR